MTPQDIAGDPEIESVRATPLGRYVIDRCTLDADCWLWSCSVNNYGYAQMNTGRFGRGMAHRLLFEDRLGRPLDSSRERLVNRCGNRRCCNPEHWRIVSPGRVIASQYRDGARGGPERLRASAHRSHLGRATSDQVGPARAAKARELRAQGLSNAAIAQQLGVSRATASKLASGRAWAPLGMFSGLL